MWTKTKNSIEYGLVGAGAVGVVGGWAVATLGLFCGVARESIARTVEPGALPALAVGAAAVVVGLLERFLRRRVARGPEPPEPWYLVGFPAGLPPLYGTFDYLGPLQGSMPSFAFRVGLFAVGSFLVGYALYRSLLFVFGRGTETTPRSTRAGVDPSDDRPLFSWTTRLLVLLAIAIQIGGALLAGTTMVDGTAATGLVRAAGWGIFSLGALVGLRLKYHTDALVGFATKSTVPGFWTYFVASLGLLGGVHAVAGTLDAGTTARETLLFETLGALAVALFGYVVLCWLHALFVCRRAS